MEKTVRTSVTLNTTTWSVMSSFGTEGGINTTPVSGNLTSGRLTTSRGVFLEITTEVQWETDQAISVALLLNGAPVFTKSGQYGIGGLTINKAQMFMAATDVLEVGVRLASGSSTGVDITEVRIEIEEK